MGCSGMGCNSSPYESTGNRAPDPKNFEVLGIQKCKSHLVVMVKYPDCTNYEGVKICVYKNLSIKEFSSLEKLDPHFSQEAYSPIARFKPTKIGLDLARKFAEQIL